MCALIFAGTLATGFLSSPGLSAGVENEDVRELWDRYVLEVSRRDEMMTLRCYGEYLYKQLAGDRTSSGRARLGTHMGEMFDLLARSYDYQIIQEEENGEKVTYTIKFTHRKKKSVHTSTVEFAEEDGEWRIIKTPEGPGFLKPGGGTFKLLGGVVLALVVIIVGAKKFFG